MATAETFEEAIVRDPDDRALSLVYADWLQSRGDPRGELIALQCELEAGDEPTLRAREQDLIETHLAEWMGGEVRGKRISLTWRRGFLHALSIDMREADPEILPRLLTSPECRFVRRLSLRTHVVAGLELLLGSPAIRRLDSLHLGSYRWLHYSTRGIAAAFPGLLDLMCDADSIALDELAFPALHHLGLALNGISLENIDALSAAELPKLEHLMLWGGRMTGDDDSAWFPTSSLRRVLDGGFPALRTLVFDACSFGDDLIDALIGSALVERLRSLTVKDDAITEAGRERLRRHTGHLDLRL